MLFRMVLDLDSQQVLEIIYAGATFGLVLTAIELLKRRGALSNEVSRKAVHISAGILLAALPTFMNRHQVILTNFGFFAGVVLLVGMLHIFTSVHAVKRWTIGEFLYPIGTGLTALLFTDLRIYVFAVYVLALGDGLAGLVGRTFGGEGYRILGGTKSLIGNVTFFVVALFLTAGFWFYSQSAPFKDGLAIILLASLLMTLVEAALAGGFDNLAVPLFAGWVAYLILAV